MESLRFQNIKLEKAKAILKYNKRQRVTMLFRFMEFCIFFVVISKFSIQLPLSFKLSTDYFKGLGAILISPPFVFVLGNAIVIILLLQSGHSSAKDGSTSNVKIDLYDEDKQNYTMNKETCCEQSKKESILVEEEAYCEQIKKQRKQSINLAERGVEKRIPRSHSGNSLRLSHDEKKPGKKMIRSATVGCLKVINTDCVKSGTTKMTTSTSYPQDGMSNGEFRKTVEAFIARQQRFLREQEFSDVVVSS